MGREVRRVPADWQHPRDERGNYVALRDGADYVRHVTEWDEGNSKWAEGLRSDFRGGWVPRTGKELHMTYVEWDGERPLAEDYMPLWSDEEATHYMMYEDTSEGSPISPAFETPEELARWLADTEASFFADIPASYERWLAVCYGGHGLPVFVKREEP